MMERSAFDILLDYPKENGLVYETHENQERFYLFPDDPVLKDKHIIFEMNDLIFYAFDSFSTRAYMSKTYTGLYGTLNSKSDINCKIYKKDWLDFIFRKNKIKTGIKYVDNNLTICSDSKSIKGLLTKDDVLLFLNIFDKINPLELLIQSNYLQKIRKLKDKKVIGIETNKWLYKKEDLDILIKLGGKLIRNIINASA